MLRTLSTLLIALNTSPLVPQLHRQPVEPDEGPEPQAPPDHLPPK